LSGAAGRRSSLKSLSHYRAPACLAQVAGLVPAEVMVPPGFAGGPMSCFSRSLCQYATFFKMLWVVASSFHSQPTAPSPRRWKREGCKLRIWRLSRGDAHVPGSSGWPVRSPSCSSDASSSCSGSGSVPGHARDAVALAPGARRSVLDPPSTWSSRTQRPGRRGRCPRTLPGTREPALGLPPHRG
jgi:hypothetical protein